MSASDGVLVLDDIRCRRGGLEILHGVSLTLSDEIVVVLGLNASGKSTLVRTISGLTRATSGTITFGGTPIDGMAANRVARLGVGYMPQHNQVFPRATVLENLRLGGFLLHRREVAGAVERELERFPKLARRRNTPAGVLSGGERQMLALAKALVPDPRLLLLDEPSAGLSPVAINDLYSVLHELRAQGIPMLMVEQNVRRGLEIADRALILALGHVKALLDVRSTPQILDVVREAMLRADSPHSAELVPHP
jgi:branched-chain amino acid transport system ATP-binding protein